MRNTTNSGRLAQPEDDGPDRWAHRTDDGCPCPSAIPLSDQADWCPACRAEWEEWLDHVAADASGEPLDDWYDAMALEAGAIEAHEQALSGAHAWRWATWLGSTN